MQNFASPCIVMEQIVTCLLMVMKFENVQQKIPKLFHINCTYETYQKIGQKIT